MALTPSAHSGTELPRMRGPSDAYQFLGVRPLINASGIYTDLGGSTLHPELWDALSLVNSRWASMLDLLDRTGRRIASVLGIEAARVVPGASAGIALSIAACIAHDDDALIETLPQPGDHARVVLQQVVHRYKYTRCALLGGGTVREFGSVEGTTEDDLTSALASDGVVAVLHPAHLDEVTGGLRLETVVANAKVRHVPVVVDAAYQVFPTELLGSFVRRGADLECVSSKYFYGPNAGGFVAGSRKLVERIAALDFTEFESGHLRSFGRAFKLDRTAVVATTLALEHWLGLDHQTRLDSYATRADALITALRERDVSEPARPCFFALNESILRVPVNAVLLAVANPGRLASALAEGEPSVRCVDNDEGLLFCVECVTDEEVTQIADAVAAVTS